jgi:hypothetical protein
MEPYPGKYVIARLKIAETGKSDSINFIVPVQNFGTLDISKVRAIIDIYGPTNEKITSIETSEVNLPVGSTIDLTADWAGVINFGKYSARLTVIYDGETTSVIEKVFSIGGASVGVLGIQVNDDFSLGEIAKFNILVESNWPESLNEVYTEMVVYDLDGKEITRFKSSTESIDSMGKEELIAYWDTAGVEKGEYRTNLIVHYDELTVSQDLRTEVSSNSIDFYLIDISGDVEKSGFKFSTTVILISVVAILIIGNIAWFVYFRKKKK